VNAIKFEFLVVLIPDNYAFVIHFFVRTTKGVGRKFSRERDQRKKDRKIAKKKAEK